MWIEKRDITVSVWIAEDGNEFDTEEKCRIHEHECMREKKEETVQKLPHFVCTPSWTDVGTVYEWYKISSKEELDTVREYLYNCDNTTWDYFEPKEYPCWLYFAIYDYDLGCGCVVGTEREILKDCVDYLESVSSLCNETDGAKIKELVSSREGN